MTQSMTGDDVQGETSIIPVKVGPLMVILPDPDSPFNPNCKLCLQQIYEKVFLMLLVTPLLQRGTGDI